MSKRIQGEERLFLDKALRDKRREMEIPPERIATALGCSMHTIRQYERQNRTMPVRLIKAYEKVVLRYSEAFE